MDVFASTYLRYVYNDLFWPKGNKCQKYQNSFYTKTIINRAGRSPYWPILVTQWTLYTDRQFADVNDDDGQTNSHVIAPNSQSVINQENISHAVLDTTEGNVPYQYSTVGVPITNLDFLDDIEGYEGDSLEDSEETYT